MPQMTRYDIIGRVIATCGVLFGFVACSAREDGATASARQLPFFTDMPAASTSASNDSSAGSSGASPGGSLTPTDPAMPSQSEVIPSVMLGTEPTSMSGDDENEVDGQGPEEPSVDEIAEPVVPEGTAGCIGTRPPTGELSIRVSGVDAAYAITLPPGYDGTTAVPLIFGFHGRGRTHREFQQIDASQIETELGGRAVMAYLESQGGNGWNFPEEVPPNIAFFEALYPRLMETYCVDPGRVFAVGHSSGGYFANILACRFGDRFRGIGAVAGALQENNCLGRVAALLVHGVRDSVVSFASDVASRDAYLARNGCSSTTQAAPIAPCVTYQGCAEGFPVRWCEHEEPTYENTNHGWPSFASRAVGEFLFSLP